MSTLLRVLQVEDSESDAALMVQLLEEAGYTVQAQRVDEALGMRAALAQQPWDVIICDYRLPQFDGNTALSLLRASGLDTPFIIVSGMIGEEFAVAMMKSGAHDYLKKDKLTRLVPTVEREIKEAHGRQERRREQQTLRETVRELESALAEKTILLKEIHHRVKNNMAVISSLLHLKAEASENAEVRQALSESQQRVSTMALVHELLYSSHHIDRINFSEYAQQFVPALASASSSEPGQIAIEMEVDPIELGIQCAAPCALILNELLSNAFKHGFHGRRAGKILVSFHRSKPGSVELVVEDDGIGLPAGFLEQQENKSLGLRIVRILSKQLGGSVKHEPCSGTRFVVRFPYRAPGRIVDETADQPAAPSRSSGSLQRGGGAGPAPRQ